VKAILVGYPRLPEIWRRLSVMLQNAVWTMILK